MKPITKWAFVFAAGAVTIPLAKALWAGAHAPVHGVAVPAAELPGGAKTVRIEELVPLAKKYAQLDGFVELVSIEALHVQSDGAIDVTKPGHLVKLVITSNERGGPFDRTTTIVEVGEDGLRYGEPWTEAGLAVSEPHCTPSRVWAHMLTLGAPPDREAHLQFEARDKAWWFYVDGAPFQSDVRIHESDCRVAPETQDRVAVRPPW